MLVLILEDLEDFALLPLAPLEPRMLLEALDYFLCGGEADLDRPPEKDEIRDDMHGDREV